MATSPRTAPRSPASPRTSAMRVLAHPLRSRLVAELRIHGPATASALARSLQTNSGATSYHLRQLAEVGLIKDTKQPAGRRRIWEAVTDPAADAEPEAGRSSRADGTTSEEDEHSVATWLALDYLEHFGERARQWVDERDTWPCTWSAAGLEDHLVLVSAEHLTALRAELVEVMHRYRRVGQGNPQAKRVVVYTCAIPLDGPPRHLTEASLAAHTRTTAAH